LIDYGPVRELSAGHDAANVPELFVIGADAQTYAHKLDASGRPTGSYLGLGGAATSISVTPYTTGNPLLFAVGTDGQVYRHKLDAAGSPSGPYLGTSVAPGGADRVYAGSDVNGNTRVFAVFTSDSQVYAETLDVSGGSSGPFRLNTAGKVKKLVVV